MINYEQIARTAGFTIRTFGNTQKIARHNSDGKYVVSIKNWYYACIDANLIPQNSPYESPQSPLNLPQPSNPNKPRLTQKD